MFLSISKPENWVTIWIMLVGLILFFHVLAYFGIQIGAQLGIQSGGANDDT
jgi:amino acid transporter